MTSINMSGEPQETPRNPPPQMMERQHSYTMEYFLETNKLDASTADLLRKYDKDGNGSFSKDEVVAIIMDLREAMKSNENLGQHNRLFKRMLVAACLFCILLLSSMFGLSYAVAALTAKTDVDADGSLVRKGSHDIVSTNARAEIHLINANEDGNYCVTRDEAEIMRMEVSNGRNVMVETTNPDGQQRLTMISGAGAYDDGDALCFIIADGKVKCWVPMEQCNESNSGGRKLSHTERNLLRQIHGRRLEPNEGAWTDRQIQGRRLNPPNEGAWTDGSDSKVFACQLKETGGNGNGGGNSEPTLECCDDVVGPFCGSREECREYTGGECNNPVGRRFEEDVVLQDEEGDHPRHLRRAAAHNEEQRKLDPNEGAFGDSMAVYVFIGACLGEDEETSSKACCSTTSDCTIDGETCSSYPYEQIDGYDSETGQCVSRRRKLPNEGAVQSSSIFVPFTYACENTLKCCNPNPNNKDPKACGESLCLQYSGTEGCGASRRLSSEEQRKLDPNEGGTPCGASMQETYACLPSSELSFSTSISAEGSSPSCCELNPELTNDGCPEGFSCGPYDGECTGNVLPGAVRKLSSSRTEEEGNLDPEEEGSIPSEVSAPAPSPAEAQRKLDPNEGGTCCGFAPGPTPSPASSYACVPDPQSSLSASAAAGSSPECCELNPGLKNNGCPAGFSCEPHEGECAGGSSGGAERL